MHSHPIRAAVFDIDGTLAMLDKDTGTYAALPGAVAVLRALDARGMPVVAYTNGTFFPPAHYYPLLAEAGLVLAPGHILTPATVAARQLAKMGVKRLMTIAAEGGAAFVGGKATLCHIHRAAFCRGQGAAFGDFGGGGGGVAQCHGGQGQGVWQAGDDWD
jgi:ribonucleotide monophosphatase NagD (HAD superfamily)